MNSDSIDVYGHINTGKCYGYSAHEIQWIFVLKFEYKNTFLTLSLYCNYLSFTDWCVRSMFYHSTHKTEWYIYNIYIYHIILDDWPSNIDYIGRRKLYWTRRSRCNIYWTVIHPILNILFTIKINLCEYISIFSANGEILIIFSLSTLVLLWYIGTACAECP